MKKEHIEKIEECLMRPPSPAEDFSWGPSYSFEVQRQKEALEAFRAFVDKAPKDLFDKGKKPAKPKKEKSAEPFKAFWHRYNNEWVVCIPNNMKVKLPYNVVVYRKDGSSKKETLVQAVVAPSLLRHDKHWKMYAIERHNPVQDADMYDDFDYNLFHDDCY